MAKPIARKTFVLSIAVAAAAGAASTLGIYWSVAVLFLDALITALLVWLLDVDLGYQRLLLSQVVVEFAVVLPVFLLVSMPLIWAAPEALATICYILVVAWVSTVENAGQRISIGSGYTLIMLGIAINAPGHIAPHSQAMAFATMIKAQVLCFVVYHRDQSVLAMMILLQYLSGTGAGYIITQPRKAILLGIAVAAGSYTWVVWERRGRQIPAGLHGTKFIKLWYLREMLRKQQRIPRCQDLPEEAFGDPTKALFIVVVSHRWLDRQMCDLPTDEYPCGVRLHLMVERFNRIFSPRGFGAGRGFWGKWRRIQAGLASGCDVLIFFDWMSLPQEGLDQKGNSQRRSPEEHELFSRLVANMPGLYSTFDVCVFSEVTEGLAEYEASGWCFSERCVASLGRRLDFFSAEWDLPEFQRHSTLRVSAASNLHDGLADKVFTNESDREVVHTLLSDFAKKRCLVDAVAAKNAEDVRAILEGFHGHRRDAMLNCDVDHGRGTVLHLAIRNRDVEVTRVLLEHGADVTARNTRGDLPTQWFMCPRINPAARLARRRKRISRRASSLSEAGQMDFGEMLSKSSHESSVSSAGKIQANGDWFDDVTAYTVTI